MFWIVLVVVLVIVIGKLLYSCLRSACSRITKVLVVVLVAAARFRKIILDLRGPGGTF